MEEAMTTQERSYGWRKSSFSDTGNGCVEVAGTLTSLRDSKHPAGPTLAVDVAVLVASIRRGRLS
jgi:hypothetical protein